MREASQPVVTAGIYCRISLAAIGDTTKTDDQERICRELGARLGWDIGGVYCDLSRSAWHRNRKRKDWDRMLGDVEAGKLNGLLVYHGDRLIRQPFDLELLLNLSFSRGVKLASPTGVRDLSNPDDQFVLRIEAAMACRESDNTSRRKKAQYARMRRKGLTRPGGQGGRAFGWESDGISHKVPDRCEIATRSEVSEPAIIREAAAAILAGRSPRSVLRELTARGVRSTAGNVMTQASFQRMLTLPRQAGLMPDGEATAAWEPILDRAAWESLRLLLTGRPQIGRTGVPLHLLSGIAVCGRPGCGHKMWAAQRDAGKLIYKCPPDGGCGKVSRRRDLLDAYVIAAVVARLGKEGNPAARVPKTPGVAAEFAALARQRAEIEAAMADHTQGTLSLLLARLDSADRRLAQLRELAGDSASARLRDRYAGITEKEFRALPLTVQRSLLSACVDVLVLPASRRGPGFSTDDVRLTETR